jgi:DNA-binding CsgD family transcriptional regulator
MSCTPQSIVQSESLEFLMSLGQAQAGIFCLVDSSTEEHHYTLRNVSMLAQDEYLQHFAAIDPMHPRNHDKRTQSLIPMSGLPANLHKQRQIFLAGFMRRFGYNDILVMFLRNASRIAAGITLVRSNNCPFSSDDVYRLAKSRDYIEFRENHSTYSLLIHNNGNDVATFPLTRRERQILNYALDGASNCKIARALCIEVSTVKTHLRHAYAKLQVRNRIELLTTNWHSLRPEG